MEMDMVMSQNKLCCLMQIPHGRKIEEDFGPIRKLVEKTGTILIKVELPATTVEEMGIFQMNAGHPRQGMCFCQRPRKQPQHK
jgi:tripartite-type tricarboxylate transporter receptor subunit TctC